MKIRRAIIGLAVVGAALAQPVAGLAKNGADDPPGHDRGDDRLGSLIVPESRNGADGATGDDRGRGHGADDPAGHDAGDDHGGLSGGHGADDPAGHDAGDDHGGDR